MPSPGRFALAAVLVALIAGCGEDQRAAAPAAPTAAASAVSTPTATASASPADQKRGEDQPGGAGDEEPARVPLEFTLGDGGLRPARISVPAFLGLELIVHNRTGEPRRVALEGSGELDVPAGDTARTHFEGRRPGTYRVDAGPAGHAEVVVGVEPGP